MRIKIILSSLAFLYFFLTGCNLKQESNNALIEAKFNIDDNLLDTIPFIDSSLYLSIQKPIKWTNLDSGFETTIKSSLLTNDYKDANLTGGFFNRQDSSFMVILDISSVDSMGFSNLRNNYTEILNKNNFWNNIQFQEFKHGCYRIEQYVLQNEQILNFKLICYEIGLERRQPKFEILYILNRKKIEENIKSIESSIGSLKCITF
ncbi:MAG: hypothetical protein JSV22_05080 [Bacteroidales bacterium]|nr:MAG: hypothetical protein JSV22_05080 [Bacteroidales bacterium]